MLISTATAGPSASHRLYWSPSHTASSLVHPGGIHHCAEEEDEEGAEDEEDEEDEKATEEQEVGMRVWNTRRRNRAARKMFAAAMEEGRP